MRDPAPRIRHARPDESALLAALGARLFRQAYEPTHPEPELTAYLARTCTAAGFAAAIASEESAVLVAEDDAGALAAYALLREGPPPTPLPATRPLEVVRFYVDAPWHGRGVAHALMDACVAHARTRAIDLLWLQAWQQAPQALAFYRKAGFTIAGDAVFEFGTRRDADFLLVREV